MIHAHEDRRHLDRYPAAGMQITLSAQLDSVDHAVNKLTEFLRAQGLSLYIHELSLLAREALNNAVTHGCGERACNRVLFKARRVNGSFEMIISDAGPGFIWSKADFDPPETCDACGRGLPIMARYADHVYFNEAGNELVLVKSLQSCEVPLIEIFERESGLAVRPLGDLTASVVQALREQIFARMGDNTRNLTVDCSRIGMVDSVGLGLFISLHNALAPNGGRLRLEGVRSELHSLLTSMRLHKHFDVVTAHEDAQAGHEHATRTQES